MSSPSLLNGLPAWVRAIATVGFPIVVAAYLLLAVTGVVPSALSKEHESFATTQEQVRKDLVEREKERDKVSKDQAHVLRLICANTARTEAVALECLR